MADAMDASILAAALEECTPEALCAAVAAMDAGVEINETKATPAVQKLFDGIGAVRRGGAFARGDGDARGALLGRCTGALRSARVSAGLNECRAAMETFGEDDFGIECRDALARLARGESVDVSGVEDFAARVAFERIVRGVGIWHRPREAFKDETGYAADDSPTLSALAELSMILETEAAEAAASVAAELRAAAAVQAAAAVEVKAQRRQMMAPARGPCGPAMPTAAPVGPARGPSGPAMPPTAPAGPSGPPPPDGPPPPAEGAVPAPVEDGHTSALRQRATAGDGAWRPYKTLGISVSADATAIKGAYRRLSLKFHPDKQKPELRDVATTVFAKIVAAYELLSNPVSRKNFDQAPEAVRRRGGYSQGDDSSDDEGPLLPAEEAAKRGAPRQPGTKRKKAQADDGGWTAAPEGQTGDCGGARDAWMMMPPTNAELAALAGKNDLMPPTKSQFSTGDAAPSAGPTEAQKRAYEALVEEHLAARAAAGPCVQKKSSAWSRDDISKPRMDPSAARDAIEQAKKLDGRFSSSIQTSFI